MMTDLATLLALTGNEVIILAVICLIGGMVRGFSGFALSAMVMALPLVCVDSCRWSFANASAFHSL